MENTQIWNPIQYQGTRWFTLRETSNGLYLEIYYEVDRNSKGNVTVCPFYAWKTSCHLQITLEKLLTELLTETQIIEKLLENKKWHPSTVLMCGGQLK
jgi:hypothetical protein